jgi:hypothetical protein
MGKYKGWDNVASLVSRSFICGHCGKSVASEMGYYHDNAHFLVYICHFCQRPTFFNIGYGQQVPGEIFGDDITDISDQKILELYNEARRCVTCNAFTGAVLCCRKLLMSIAVEKGAKEGLKFIEYVEFLSSKGYVPPDGKEWVDHIRKKGNDATHEIVIMEKQDAEDLITFIEMLLKFIYEFPGKVKKRIVGK